MTEPRRWTTVVIPGTPPVEVVEASAYDETRAELRRLRPYKEFPDPLQDERDRYREALEHLRDHYEPSVGTNYVCAGMAEYVCEVTNRALLNGEDE